MTKDSYNLASTLVTRNLLIGLFSFTMLLPYLTHAQVNFTQTYDADFNLGVLNNVVVGSNSVYLQNSASDVGSWLTATVLPQTLSGHKAASWTDRYVYVVGGYNGLTYSNAVYYTSINSGGIGSWTSLNPLPAAVKDAAVVIGTNTIYVLGGRDGSQVYNTIYYAAIHTDGTLGAWQTSAVTLPVSLWGHSALYLKGYIYIAGGSSSMTETTALNNVYYTKVNVDNTISSFTAGTALPSARNKHTMVTYNGNLYVLGGYDNTGTKANTVYIDTPGLNGAPGAWSIGTPLPVAISNHSSVSTNGIITVMAGETASSLTNTVYYANADAGSLVWQTSVNAMYDITKDGSAFQANGLVFYTGGINPSGSPIFNSRFAHLSLTANYANHGVFVSTPFTQLGAERLISSLSFTAVYSNPANCQVTYRVAGNDGIWSDWAVASSVSPITVNITKRYLQYAVYLTGSSVQNSTLQDVTLITPGTQLSGDISGTSTFTKALSPYWATSDIWFSSGTHTFQAGATILFLPQTGLEIGQANVICNGTIADSVKFMYYTSETGQWKGLYFDPNSDAGVSSQFNYTAIIGGGYGSWSADLYCNSTNEPLLSHCSIRSSGAHGIVLSTSSINLQSSSVRANTLNGIYAASSSPTILGCALSYNGGAGIYLTSTGSVPTYNGTTIDHNVYGIRYDAPNFTFYPPNGLPTLTGNTYNGLAINGGVINTSDREWTYMPYDYILLGTVTISQNPSVRLTIEPGNTIKSLPGVQIQVSSGGGLYAIGTSDSTITFTAYNGQPGGWDGIYFMDGSDNWGGQSQLDYCIIEKGNNYNYFSENTIQPNLINHTVVQNALLDGARYASSPGSPSGAISNVQFLNNGRYPLYILDGYADPLKTSVTYTGNGVNRIALAGGFFYVDRTLKNEGIPFFVLNNMILGQWGGHATLTINPGVVMEFDVGKRLYIGAPSSYGGNLNAQGTLANPIIFQPHNLAPGGWKGIYFPDANDNFGGSSILKYCTIKQADTADILIENSTQPTLDHCTIGNSALNGIVEYQSNPPITNCTFTGNGGYPLVYRDWTCDSYLSGNTYTGNTHNYILLPGGQYSANRTLYNDGIPYEVQNQLWIGSWGGAPILTLRPGITLAFDPGTNLQVGSVACCNGGGISAVGKADSIIIFKPINNTIGGWGGIYFPDYNDNWGATSTLKYCNISKGAAYDVSIETSAQPTMDHCTLDQSGGVGINVSNSPLNITNCIISNSASHGIAGTGITGQILSNQFLNNGGYPLKFNDQTCSPYLHGDTYTGNTPNYIYVTGGDYASNVTYYYDGIPYHVFGNIRMLSWGGRPRLTLKPGVTMAFEPGTYIQLGTVACCNGGEIDAQGKADSVITFVPYNNLPGGWGGIYFTSYNDDWGGTSTFKYCNITKGAGYNINVEGSNQPLIDHCSITQSTGKGLIINNSNLTITNSIFSNNASNGIYVDGTGTATLGNAAALTCSLFDNGGGYQLYNNSTANISARYNYWGTADSTMIEAAIFDRYDNPAKGIVYIGPYAQLPALATPTTILGGTLKYANTGANPIKNAAMVIRDFSGTTIASTTSNSSGVYAFSAFPSGNYQMSITPAAPWGGVNSTDALLILNHFAMIAPLTGMGLAAADVNASHTINGTDALFVLRRFAGAISSFPAGDYLYHTDTIYMNGNQVTNNFKLACFGDCNLSDTPAMKSSGSVGIVYEGTISVPSNTEFDFPVIMKSGMQVGAISLGFYYPEQYLDVTGAVLENGNNNFAWTAADGLFRMGWADLNAMNISSDGVVVILKMKSKDLSGLIGNLTLQLYENSEFADESATVNQEVVLSVKNITAGTNGITPGVPGFTISVYPNPMKEKTAVEFTLGSESRVNIKLFNLVGQLVETVGETSYEPGRHQVLLNTSILPSGVYLLKVEISDAEQVSSRLIKIVVSR